MADADPTRPDGRQARWQRHNESRRQQIIDAAIEVIEEGGPGAEFHVQQIAARAHVNRTVVYRYFEDREDLNRAVQQEIINRLWAVLIPQLHLEGTVPQIIDRIVGTYVDWAVAHPALHHVVDHDYTSGALEQALDEIASQLGEIITFAMSALGGISTMDEDTLDPLMHGLVGAVFGAVRRWLNRPQRVLSPEALRANVSRSAWFVIEGHARDGGVTIDPDLTVEEILAQTLGADPPPATVGP
jgi:AcrR family transcriptional regulator